MTENEDIKISFQTLQLLISAVTLYSVHMLYSPPSGLTVTCVRLVSVLQCCCIQLLPAAADSSTLRTETLLSQQRAGTWTELELTFFKSVFMFKLVIYLPFPFASSFRCVFLIVFVVQVV